MRFGSTITICKERSLSFEGHEMNFVFYESFSLFSVTTYPPLLLEFRGFENCKSVRFRKNDRHLRKAPWSSVTKPVLDLSPIKEALPVKSFDKIADICDTLMLKVSAEGISFQDDWPYAIHLLGYFYVDDCDSARGKQYLKPPRRASLKSLQRGGLVRSCGYVTMLVCMELLGIMIGVMMLKI